MLDPWRPGWFRLAVVALVVAGRADLVRPAAPPDRRRPRSPPARWSGWPCSALVLAALAPGGSYLTAWPALVGAVAGHRRAR